MSCEVINPRKDLPDVAEQMYRALKSARCRCQMKGGAMWHFRAQREVAIQCSLCAAIERYEAITQVLT